MPGIDYGRRSFSATCSVIGGQTGRSQAGHLGLPGAGAAANPADTITPEIQQAENGVALADIGVEGAANKPADVAALSSANAQIVAAQVQLDRLLNGPSL